MKKLEKIAEGANVIDVYAGMTCTVEEGPAAKDLTNPEFLAFVDTVLKDALGLDDEAAA